MSVFVHAQGIKTVHRGGRGVVKKWQNSVHVVVECPLTLLTYLVHIARFAKHFDRDVSMGNFLVRPLRWWAQLRPSQFGIGLRDLKI